MANRALTAGTELPLSLPSNEKKKVNNFKENNHVFFYSVK